MALSAGVGRQTVDHLTIDVEQLEGMKLAVRKPNVIDLAIGGRIREHRRRLGMSQPELAHFLGVTAQQVQKYEVGLSRVGSSRLQQIARKLHVPISSLFEPVASPTRNVTSSTASIDTAILAWLGTPECIELNRAFKQIADPRIRRRVVALIVAVSKNH